MWIDAILKFCDILVRSTLFTSQETNIEKRWSAIAAMTACPIFIY